MTAAEVIILWPRGGAWSAAFLRETNEGTLVAVFTVTRSDRAQLESSLRAIWPGVPVYVLPNSVPA